MRKRKRKRQDNMEYGVSVHKMPRGNRDRSIDAMIMILCIVVGLAKPEDHSDSSLWLGIVIITPFLFFFPFCFLICRDQSSFLEVYFVLRIFLKGCSRLSSLRATKKSVFLVKICRPGSLQAKLSIIGYHGGLKVL